MLFFFHVKGQRVPHDDGADGVRGEESQMKPPGSHKNEL